MNNMDSLKLKAKELAKKYGIDMVVLFGSRADNTATNKSDFDIAYAKNEKLSFDDEMNIGSELANFFKTEEFDVVHLNKTSPAFMYQIMKKAKLLFAKDPFIFSNFFSYAIKRLHENMFLYDLKFSRLCEEYGV